MTIKNRLAATTGVIAGVVAVVVAVVAGCGGGSKSGSGLALGPRDGAEPGGDSGAMIAGTGGVSLLVIPCQAAGSVDELSSTDQLREPRGLSVVSHAAGFRTAYLAGALASGELHIAEYDAQGARQGDAVIDHGASAGGSIRVESPSLAIGADVLAVGFASNVETPFRIVAQSTAVGSPSWGAASSGTETLVSDGTQESREVDLLSRGEQGFVAVWSEQPSVGPRELRYVRLGRDGQRVGDPLKVAASDGAAGFAWVRGPDNAPGGLLYVQGSGIWLHAVSVAGVVAESRTLVVGNRSSIVGRPSGARPAKLTATLVAWSEGAVAQVHVLQVPDSGAAQFAERIVSGVGERAVDPVVIPFFDIVALAYRGTGGDGAAVRMTMLFGTGERLLTVDRVAEASSEASPLSIAMLPSGRLLGVAWTDLVGVNETRSRFVGARCAEDL